MSWEVCKTDTRSAADRAQQVAALDAEADAVGGLHTVSDAQLVGGAAVVHRSGSSARPAGNVAVLPLGVAAGGAALHPRAAAG